MRIRMKLPIGVAARSFGIILMGVAALEIGSSPAAAFPGETAEQMIERYGKPSLPTSLPSPNISALQTGKSNSVLVVWFQAKYRPLALPMEMEGRVVSSFRIDGTGVLRRIERGGSGIGWGDLRSDFENLFTSLSESQFAEFLKLVEKQWAITQRTPHADPPYDLYEAVSKDGKFKAEFSFRQPGISSPSATDPYYGGKFPDGNFWVRIQRAAS